jgi:hypothetical protein
MRDALLTFQDSVSSLGAYLKKLNSVSQDEREGDQLIIVDFISNIVFKDWEHTGMPADNTAQRSLVSDLLDESVSRFEKVESRGQNRSQCDSFLESDDRIQFERLSFLTASMNLADGNSEPLNQHNFSMDEFLMSLPSLPSYNEYVRYLLLI